MGEGQAGIVYALSVFAERTGNPRYADYARGGAAYLESRLDDDGGMPESATETQRNTGFLSGAAGAAFSFLRMYVGTGDDRGCATARRSLEFLERTATGADGGLTGRSWWTATMSRPTLTVPPGWKKARGHRLGVLQAYAVTGDERYLDHARPPGRG